MLQQVSWLELQTTHHDLWEIWMTITADIERILKRSRQNCSCHLRVNENRAMLCSRPPVLVQAIVPITERPGTTNGETWAANQGERYSANTTFLRL